MVQKGSIEWLRGIATTLGDNLLGLEMVDNRSGGDVSPVVQIQFVVPFFSGRAPRELRDATRFEGYHGVSYGSRGSNGYKSVNFMCFNFYNGPFPDKGDVISVAEEFGLTYADSYLNNDHRLQRALPYLYNS